MTGTAQTQSAEPLAALLRQEEVAKMLNVSPRVLEAWRCRGGGPTFVKISARCVRYRRDDVERFIADHLTAA